MSLEETKLLLQKHQLFPNKLLGQNFMVDASIFPKLAKYAALNVEDVILDAGAGFGFLTRFLASRCKGVLAVEKDEKIAGILKERIKGLPNVTVIEGDVLKEIIPPFTKAISIPPYYLSSHLVLWLLDRGFQSAVLIVQKEFGDRLNAKVGSEEYGWLTVVAYQGGEVELLDSVPKWMFYPQPPVDSVVVKLTPWKRPQFQVKDVALFRRLTKWLFTQRNKKLQNGLEPFLKNELEIDKTAAQKMAATVPLREKRARDLAPQDFGAISNAICK